MATETIMGTRIGPEIIEALGLPKETNLTQIRIVDNELVEVICRHYPTQEAMGRVLGVLQSYHLAPNGDPMIDDTFLGEPVMEPIRHTGEETHGD